MSDDITVAFNKVKELKITGKNAEYIPELMNQDPSLFALSIVDLEGNERNFGDSKTGVPIESVAKVFTLALVLNIFGKSVVERKIGLKTATKAFNSKKEVKESRSHTINPFVNAGAIATTSLLYNKFGSNMFQQIFENIKNFSQKERLKVNKKVYISELSTNERNQELINLLIQYDRFYGEPAIVLDAYTKQSSINVTTKDVAMMASVLANGGIHPLTGKKLISKSNVEFILRAMKLSGLYNESESFYANVDENVYVKSGVGGFLMVVIPGQCGLCVLSPPLNVYGNSSKGLKLLRSIFHKKNKKI